MVLEATDLKLDYVPPKPKTYVVDKEEEEFIKLEKRKGFEDAVRRNQGHMGTWNKYAAWEESMGDASCKKEFPLAVTRTLEKEAPAQSLHSAFEEPKKGFF